MPPKGKASSQDGLARAWLVFKTRMTALKSGQRASAALDVLKAVQALDQASNVTRSLNGVYDSPAGLSLSAAFQLVRDAGLIVSGFSSESACSNYLDQSQQRTCIRAVLRAILAALPLHCNPNSKEIYPLLRELMLDLNVANLWKVIDYEGMDRFRYRHAASAPAKAQALVQDMLLYLAVLDRIHVLVSEWEADTTGKERRTAHDANCMVEIGYFNPSVAGVTARYLELAHQAVSLSMHMIGAKPPSVLYNSGAERDADSAVALAFQPSQVLVSSPGAWVSPVNLLRRALHILAHRSNPGLWDLYRANTLGPVMNTLYLAAVGLRDVLSGEAAGGKAEALGVTPALMRSLMHALSFIYTRCIDDDNLEGNMMHIRRTITCLAGLLESSFDCSAVISDLASKKGSNSKQVLQSASEGSREQKAKRKGKGKGAAKLGPAISVDVGSGTAEGAAGSSGQAGTGSSTVQGTSSSTLQDTSSSTGPQEQQEELKLRWLIACDTGAWSLYRILHVVAYPGCTERHHRYDFTLNTSSDPGVRLESLYWVPLQTVKVAWSLAKALPVQDILAGAPGSIAFAASAASTAMVQSCCLTSDAWKEGGHAVALELAPYCRKLLRYLLSAVQALQEPYTGGKLSDAIAARSAAMVAAAEAAEAAAWAKFTASAIAPTAPAVAKAGAEAAAGSSAGAGKDEGRGKSQSTARSEGTEKSDSTEKSEGEGTGKSESAEKSDALRSMRDASTQTAGPLVTSVHLTTFEPTKEELQINLLLILAALHLSKGLSDKLVQNDPSLKVEEWVMQLVTLAADTLSLLCNLLEDGRWRAAAVKHQPLLLLHATCTGLQVAQAWVANFDAVDPYKESRVLRTAFLGYASELDSSGRSRVPFLLQLQVLWVNHQDLRRDIQIVGHTDASVRWNPNDDSHTMEVNDAVERSLTTFKRLLLTGVNNTHINNLGKKYALSQGEALSPLSTRAASQPGHARSTPTGEAAGASAAAHASGSAPTLSQDLTPQQLLALAASAATLKPPSCLWKPAEGDVSEVADWVTNIAPNLHASVLLLAVAAVHVATQAMVLDGQPDCTFRPGHLGILKLLLGDGAEGELLAGSPIEAPVSGREMNAYLLRHATVLLRSLPELQPAILPVFGQHLPHLSAIYKVDASSREALMPGSRGLWDWEQVIEAADTPEHRQYIDWLCGHLHALLAAYFVEYKVNFGSKLQQ